MVLLSVLPVTCTPASRLDIHEASKNCGQLQGVAEASADHQTQLTACDSGWAQGKAIKAAMASWTKIRS